MAIKSKPQLATDITSDPDWNGTQKGILTDMVDSYEDIFVPMTTTTRNGLVADLGQIIFNIDVNRYEYFNGSNWLGIGQDLSTPLTVKIDLTDADLLALNATPFVLVGSPGYGFALYPHTMAWRFTAGGTPYTGSYNLYLRAGTKTNSDAFLSITGSYLNSAGNLSGGRASDVITDAIIDNDTLVLSTSGALSAGNGTLTIWLTYSLIPY